jgi:hypothetical protein
MTTTEALATLIRIAERAFAYFVIIHFVIKFW